MNPITLAVYPQSLSSKGEKKSCNKKIDRSVGQKGCSRFNYQLRAGKQTTIGMRKRASTPLRMANLFQIQSNFLRFTRCRESRSSFQTKSADEKRTSQSEIIVLQNNVSSDKLVCQLSFVF